MRAVFDSSERVPKSSVPSPSLSPSRKSVCEVLIVLSAPIAAASLPGLRAGARLGIAIAARMQPTPTNTIARIATIAIIGRPLFFGAAVATSDSPHDGHFVASALIGSAHMGQVVTRQRPTGTAVLGMSQSAVIENGVVFE